MIDGEWNDESDNNEVQHRPQDQSIAYKMNGLDSRCVVLCENSKSTLDAANNRK